MLHERHKRRSSERVGDKKRSFACWSSTRDLFDLAWCYGHLNHTGSKMQKYWKPFFCNYVKLSSVCKHHLNPAVLQKIFWRKLGHLLWQYACNVHRLQQNVILLSSFQLCSSPRALSWSRKDDDYPGGRLFWLLIQTTDTLVTETMGITHFNDQTLFICFIENILLMTQTANQRLKNKWRPGALSKDGLSGHKGALVDKLHVWNLELDEHWVSKFALL